jgi:Signal transduction histidine kinase
MSHELRTPLNSILILGQQLADNPDGNLRAKQVEFARTIHGAGTDLMNLISDILDLSKIESGTVTVDAEEIFFTNVLETVARPFRHQAESQGLSFDVQIDPNLGRSVVTDSKRLQQILKNLLSNALKFTAQGSVRLRVLPARGGWRADNTAQPGKLGGGLRGHRYGCWYPRREAEDRVRGLPAGRRLDQPQVRRHRPWPRHQPRTRAAAGR